MEANAPIPATAATPEPATPPAKPVDRFERQADLVKHAKLIDGKITVSVIGVGAVGRQVALQLASIGIPSIRIVDFDKVEHVNRTTQGFTLSDVGLTKVEAVAAAIRAIDPELKVEAVNDRFRPTYGSEVMFCCVDSMEIRKTIWERCGVQARFFTDGRMLGENLQFLATGDHCAELAQYYPTTLFDDSQAEPGRCTARSTIYTASILAGMMVHQLTRWLRNQALDGHMLYNLSSGDVVDMVKESAAATAS